MWRTSPISYIYNPLNQTEEELLKNFVVREREFNTIFNDIKSSDMSHPEPHYIIQGQRGQGKTTLLLKIYYEIKKDRELCKFVIPIMFNEEQYHINTLFGLWAHTGEKLEEENQEFSGLYEKIESAYETEDSEIEAFNLLEGDLKEKKRKMILLIDNIGQLLDKLTLKEQQRLREVLIVCPEIRIIGASAFVLEYTYDYSKPFYELFRIITLESLTQKEAMKLLLKLGEHYRQENIKKIIEKEPGRVQTLRRLTGGVPRTMVLLFEIFVEHEKGEAFQDLELILDRVTPLYKHRMDDLSPQQQKIVDAIALNWDAMPAGDIAKKTRMESKAVSAQLKLLEKNRIIHKIKTTTKNHLYQVTERFFNIWYLMRYGSRRGRSRVQWLVHFLQAWCSKTELTIKKEKILSSSYSLSFLLLWNNEIEESLKIEKKLMENEDYIEGSITSGNEYLLLLLAKKQYYAALKIFEENPFDLKERIKPIYYALIYFLEDDFPNEYKKMGAELKETVEEIIASIKKWEKDYA